MALKQIMVAGAIVLACLVANASAFVAPMTTARAPATTSARSTASGMHAYDVFGNKTHARTHVCAGVGILFPPLLKAQNGL